MKIYEALNFAKNKLHKFIKNRNQAYLEAEGLLLHILKISREELYTKLRGNLKDFDKEKYINLVFLRCKRMPKQYLTKSAYFHDKKFYIERGVFIPRPETECVIDAVKHIKGHLAKNSIATDIGTGSGIIPLALLKETKKIKKIYAFDISKQAIKVSRINAKRYDTSGKIKFIHRNFFKNINRMRLKFDIVLSNPPYIKMADMKKLPKEVLQEPHSALTDKKDGLSFYKKFKKYAKIYLKNKGYLVFEIGDNMSHDIRKIFKGKEWVLVKSLFDFNNKERAMAFRYLGQTK